MNDYVSFDGLEGEIHHYVGLVIFIILFVGLIPRLLIKLVKDTDLEEQGYIILEAYMANLDLLATSLSFQNGPLALGYFEYLYKRTDIFIGYLSFNIISLISLTSLLFIILIRTKKKFKKTIFSPNIIFFILSQFIIMVCITFLFPNKIIEIMMGYLGDILKDNFSLTKSIVWPICVSLGLIISAIVIIFESWINNEILQSIIKNFIIKAGPFVKYAFHTAKN